MNVYIFNLTSVSQSYLNGAVVVPANGSVLVPSEHLCSLSFDAQLLGDLRLSQVVLGDGVTQYAESYALSFLDVARRLSQKDSDNAAFTRLKQAPTGWGYQMRGVEVTTSLLTSLNNTDILGANIGDATLYFYDAAGGLINTQAAADTSCVRTVLEIIPPYDYYLIGGVAKVAVKPLTDVRLSLIVAPDVPYAYGGSRVNIQNINFKYIGPDDSIQADGRASKFVPYAASGTPTNKLKFIINHNAGVQTTFALFIEHYKL